MSSRFQLGPKSQAFADTALDHVWHPCTQMKDHESMPIIPIAKGKGIWLEDFDGKRYIDAVSSWWVNLFGHSNDFINGKIQEQLSNLEHVILAGFTHQPIVDLSKRLVEKAPQGLTRCFYADNGSSAVEVALKMSFHSYRNKGQHKKTRFISISNGYHGETLAALAVSGVALYKEIYGPLLLDPIEVPSPDSYYRPEGVSPAEHAREMFKHMEAALEEHHETVCAVILEPLIQCAGGMRMYDPEYLRLLREACDKYGVHLIADEIAVGFGRTGTFFACEQADITPDFLCLSKGITAGYLPLSVVMTNEKIYQDFYDDYETLKAFLHSHSYTGNPLACAAALATLDLFERDNVIEENKKLAKVMADSTAHLIDHPHVGDVRQTGMVLAVEMVKDKKTKEAYPWQERRGLDVFKYALNHECLLRPLGNVVYMMPPYVIQPEEIQLLAKVMTDGINAVTAK
ncbi:MAG: adenosylmethionine--8-amino-7-oxononanoate transaminase [Pseudomonadota bacterium]|nr:adenosylmethionine--8-amino-7-oxononanoate transaminase [Gammaproteobacteria bacterium]MEC8011055.1 adenosylmethionine--8-amino-7-oxononanoate transaminase [Pseudomonadota bacterium]HBF09579.1 adenosylmethionine--8-amino-7-oxononanoate transaminase [Gammaproteobacteria bacterium]|tara:strand:- start:12343 stop:13716 length:1374 start_codon:yes stop_codon:yes gene_type:complete